MREILFRAKRQDTGEWEQGYYVSLPCANGVVKLDFIVDKYGEKHGINLATLCQYTGVTDRNGTKIFESDIVTSDQFCPDEEGYGVINWRDDELMFVVETDDAYYDFININWTKLEVIGNVFDNPELIRGVEE